MTANNDTSKNTNKNVCLKLDDTESARLGYIMHEIHGTLTSIDREISDIAKADLSFPKNHAEIKEKAVTAQRLSTELRTLLDFWQISNSNNYFENSVAHPQALCMGHKTKRCLMRSVRFEVKPFDFRELRCSVRLLRSKTKRSKSLHRLTRRLIFGAKSLHGDYRRLARHQREVYMRE